MAASIPFQISSAQAGFESQLRSNIQHFRLYEDKSNQAKALQHVPLQDLLAVAQAKFDSSDDSSIPKPTDGGKVVQDMLLLELMEWFKTEFFTWMNSPPCPRCKKPTEGIGAGVPTSIERSMSASRVEIYTCTSCFSDKREVARFPRYNNPVVLLDTRTGRCGEWANCFALICRAVGFEIRHVHDYTDHVWLEVYSCSLTPNRWVHVDPCENSYDNPLLYEVGWGKKLTYIIAVSQDDIQDVTSRYTKDLNKILARRREVSEDWLVKILLHFRKELQSGLAHSRKEELQKRWVHEIVEFLTSKSDGAIKESEKVGRESGSIAWRLARQELGESSASSSSAANGFIWEIGDTFLHDGRFELAYDSELDGYVRRNKNGENVFVKGWQNGVFLSENLFRKEELDWKMVYLATRENSKSSKICWKFRLEPDCAFEDVKIDVKYSIFQSDAKLVLKVTNDQSEVETILETNSGDQTFSWDSNSATSNFQTQLQKSRTFTLDCELKGGSGNEGWQKVQLFRQQVIGAKPVSAVNRSLLNIGFKIKKI